MPIDTELPICPKCGDEREDVDRLEITPDDNKVQCRACDAEYTVKRYFSTRLVKYEFAHS